MLMVSSFDGKIFFYPTSENALGDSQLPNCFVFDAKMRFAATSVGLFKPYLEVADANLESTPAACRRSQLTKVTLVLCTFEGFSVVYDNVMLDIGSHDYYSSLALSGI